MSISVIISGVVALTLTPSLCVLILKRRHRPPGRAFRWFNDWFHRVTGHYADGVGFVLRPRRHLHGAVRRHGGACRVFMAHHAGQSGPDEDQGYYIGAVFLPDGASLQRTDEVVSRVIEQAMSNPANEYAVAFTGMDFLGGGFRNSAATIFVTQKHWDERNMNTQQLVGEFFGKTAGIKKRWCSAFNRRRSSVWATRAASSSTCRIAERAARPV
jgi:multidrug efflux pump subunit AcrB